MSEDLSKKITEPSDELMAYTNRRTVSRKEKIGYVIYDSSQSFNLNSQKETFVDSILGISFNLQSVNNFIGGIWDIINDVLIGTVVDRTRTRWGKFRPYLFAVALPLAILSAVYWLLPVIFEGKDANYIPKFIAYMIFEVFMETCGTFKEICRSGLISTITPYPVERSKLIAFTSYFTGWFGGLPGQIIEVLFDLVTNNLIKSATKTSTEFLTRVYVIMGPSTVLLSGFVAFWFVFNTRERVQQSIERPSITEGIKQVIRNRPTFVYILSQALSSFGTGISTNKYYKWVLFFGTMETVAGIPSAIVIPMSYAAAPKLLTRYSMKGLYIVSNSFAKAMYIPVFLIGMIGDKKDKVFMHVPPMMVITAIWEIIYAAFGGIKTVVNTEMRNECMDYCEWKYGYRSEATITAAKSVIQKIPSRLNSIMEPQIKKMIGFVPELYPAGKKQKYKTQAWIFAMATLVPAVITLIGSLPILFYNIDRKTKEQMYNELTQRRAALGIKVTLEG
ncbi:MAG: MFS transporter [Acutalibacteraceae bacterium]